MRTSRLLVLLVVAMISVVGGPTAAGGQGEVATISGHAYTFNTRNVIAGATIKAVEFPEVTTTTAADGSYTLDLPVGSQVTLYIEAEGHSTIHIQTFTLDQDHEGTAVDGANFQTPTLAVYEGLRSLVEGYVGRDPFEGGCVVVTTVGVHDLVGMPFEQFIRFAPHGVEGATATLTPALSDPIYFNSSVVPDLAQAATSNDGGVLWPNVPAGEYELSASHPDVSFTTATVRCEEGRVVNANPVWGLHSLTPGPITTEPPSEPGTTAPAVPSPTPPTAPAPAPDGNGAGASPSEPQILPRTGIDGGSLAASAVILLLGGTVVLALTRRHDRTV